MTIDDISVESLGFDEYTSDLQFSNEAGSLLGRLELLVDDCLQTGENFYILADAYIELSAHLPVLEKEIDRLNEELEALSDKNEQSIEYIEDQSHIIEVLRGRNEELMDQVSRLNCQLMLYRD